MPRDGCVLVAGGRAALRSLATAEICDPRADRWTATGSMREARRNHIAALLPGGRVLVVGGADADGNGLASAELFDAATGSWFDASPLAEARRNARAITLDDGRVLVTSGRTTKIVSLASTELYDSAAGAWTERRYEHTATLLPDLSVLAAGGTDNSDHAATSATAEVRVAN